MTDYYDDIRTATVRAEEAFIALAADNESLRSLLTVKDAQIAELEADLAECRSKDTYAAVVNPSMTVDQIKGAITDAGEGARILWETGTYGPMRVPFLHGQFNEAQIGTVINLKRKVDFFAHLRSQKVRPESVTFSGFKITGATNAGIVPWIGTRIFGCEISDCGWSGVRGQFENGRCNNEIADSYFHHNGWDPDALGHGAAGVKYLNGGRGDSIADGLRSYRNIYENNTGNGLWLDQDWRWFLSEDDMFLGNSLKGFFNEVSRGPSEVRGYITRGNGQAGLQVNGSQNVLIGPGVVGGNARDRGIVVNDVLDTRKDSYRYAVENVVIARSQITFEDGDGIIVENAAAGGVSFI
jgi:hypothetical protein